MDFSLKNHNKYFSASSFGPFFVVVDDEIFYVFYGIVLLLGPPPFAHIE